MRALQQAKPWTVGSIILLICLSYFHFFRPIFLNDDLLKLFYYLVLGGVASYSFKVVFYKNELVFFKPIKFFFISVFISIVCAAAFWNQDFLTTFISSIPFFSFFIYFYLFKTSPNVELLEKIVIIFTVIYVICFIAALIVAPVKIFTGYGELDKELDTSRGL